MAVAFVKHINTFTAKDSGTTLTFTVPAGGAAAGNRLVLKFGGRTSTSSVTDPRSNTWELVNAALNTNGTTATSSALWVAHITNAYTAGDVITLNLTSGHSDGRAGTMDEYSGVSSDLWAAGLDNGTNKNGNLATSTTPTVTLAPTAAGALVVPSYTGKGVVGGAFTGDTDSTGGQVWNVRTHAGTTGGGGTSNRVVRSQDKLGPDTSLQTWDPTTADVAYEMVIGALAVAGAAATKAFPFSGRVARNPLLRR